MPTAFNFSDDDIHDLLCDMISAEALPLPGDGKHHWVIACAIARRAQSPPPVWTWLLVRFLNQLIPFLIEWLKEKYGIEWAARLYDILSARKAPWLDSDQQD